MEISEPVTERRLRWLEKRDYLPPLSLDGSSHILLFSKGIWEQIPVVARKTESYIEIVFHKMNFNLKVLGNGHRLAYLVFVDTVSENATKTLSPSLGCVLYQKDILLRKIPLSRFSEIYSNQQVVQNARYSEQPSCKHNHYGYSPVLGSNFSLADPARYVGSHGVRSFRKISSAFAELSRPNYPRNEAYPALEDEDIERLS